MNLPGAKAGIIEVPQKTLKDEQSGLDRETAKFPLNRLDRSPPPSRETHLLPPMSPRIEQIETYDVLYPAAGRFKFLNRQRGLAPGRPTVVVKLTADDGTVGWGQAVPSPRWSYETPESVRSTIDGYLTPALIGADAADLDAAQAIMDREIAPSFSIGQPIAKSAVEMSLHDLAGRLAGQPVAERLGPGKRREILLSWTIHPATAEEVAAEMARATGLGYRSFNIKIAPNPDADRELCTLVRQLAPESFLWADANGGYTEDSARAMLPILADLGFAALEQPVPANRLREYGRLKKLAVLPILMDEGIVSHVELEEFASLDLLDGVAMKVARCGGLREALRIARVAQDRELILFGSGLTDPDIALAASLSLFSAIELPYPVALNAPQYLSESILRRPFEVSDGSLRVPNEPGLGVEVDETRLAASEPPQRPERRDPDV